MEKDLRTKTADKASKKTSEKTGAPSPLSEDRLKFQLSGWEIRDENTVISDTLEKADEKGEPRAIPKTFAGNEGLSFVETPAHEIKTDKSSSDYATAATEAVPLKEQFKGWDQGPIDTEFKNPSKAPDFDAKNEAFKMDAAQVLADIQDQLTSTATTTSTRTKSSQRLRYEAEISVLKRKLGGLEEIREKLGLSQRKICQLLMVDPSAWTRWTKEGENAPPHIYRALQWYLALEEKYPALDVNFWLQTVARTTSSESIAARTEIESLEGKLEDVKQNFASQSLTIMDRAFAEIRALKEEVEMLRKRSLFINSAILAAAFLFIAGFLWSRLT